MQHIVEVDLAKKVVSMVLMLMALYFYFSQFYAIPQFEETFESFGSDLPLVTKAAIFVRPVYFLLGAFSLGILFIWRNSGFGKLSPYLIYKGAIVNVIFSFVSYLFCSYAMYLPIFQLAML